MLMRFLIFITLLLFSITAIGQHCSTDQVHADKIGSDPTFKENRKRIKKALLLSRNKEQRGDTIIIPVVFHIYHNGDPLGEQENITDELVQAQVEQLNKDFRRNNGDASMTPSAFEPLAADTDIEFCLASVDPNGEETTGILRNHINTLSGVDESDCWTTNYIDDNFVKPTIWDREDYLNIYSILSVDNLENGNCDFFASLGYAQFPGGDASTDAVVLSFYTIGSEVMPNPLQPQFIGRTATHEVGHWLDLEHPWGSNPGSCNLDDDVADTPTQLEGVFGCSSFPLFDNCTTSGDGIMYNNFMQYSDDDCMNMFTTGQRSRMRNLISVVRPTLLVSLCQAEVLSIESIVGFNARLVGSDIIVDWTIENKDDISHVQLEHGTSITQFSDIAYVDIEPFSSASNYNHIHKNPSSGIHYYRLRFYGTNNKVTYSDVISVVKSSQQIVVRANPVYQELEIKIPSDIIVDSYTIFDTSGRELLGGKYLESNQSIEVEGLNGGVYIIHLSTNRGSTLIKWVKV